MRAPLLPLALALLTPLSAAAPLPGVAGYDIEAPEAAVNHRLCAADDAVCAEVHATGTIRECDAATCTVRFALELLIAGERASCGHVETEPTGGLTNCVAGAVTTPERAVGEKSYPRAGGVFREPARLCVDYSTPAQMCARFNITVRLAESGSLAANLTTAMGVSAGDLTLCEEEGCASLRLAAFAQPCEEDARGRACHVTFEFRHSIRGRVCSNATLEDFIRTSRCGSPTGDGFSVSFGKTYRDVVPGEIVTERARMCLLGPAPRCLDLRLDIRLG